MATRMHAQARESQPTSSSSPAAGFSLVELMVAVTIGLLILLAMSTLLSQQSRSRDELDKSAGQIENGRYALVLLQNDLQHAGFYGVFGGTIAAPAALPNPCATTNAAIDESLGMPVQGYDAPATIPAPLSGCLADANHVPGTDVLVIRRVQANDTLPAIGSLVSGRVYVQTTPIAKVIGRGGTSPSPFTLLKKDNVTPADIRAYVEHIYFISPCNVFESGQTVCTAEADGGSPIPTLKRLELGVSAGSPAFVTVALVEGIQDMQLDYGLDAANSGAPSTPFITAPTLAQWPNVMAVDVTLLARNTRPTRGFNDTRTYDMGAAGSVGPFNDEFKRHVYKATVRLINPSGRRE